MWEHFAHGGDIGIRGRGDTRDQASAEAAEAAGLAREVARLAPFIVVKG
jgi:SHS2 domain-containing protein